MFSSIINVSVLMCVGYVRGNLFILMALLVLSNDLVVLCREPKIKHGLMHLTHFY